MAYSIHIDGKRYIGVRRTILGRDILAVQGKSIQHWALNVKYRSGARKAIAADEVVDLAQTDIERFETVKRIAIQG